MSTDDLTIDIDDKAIDALVNQGEELIAPAVTPAAPVEKSEPDAVAAMKAELEQTRRQAATLQAERDRAADAARQHAIKAYEATERAKLSDYNMLTGSLAAAEREISMLEDRMQAAFDAGDGKAVTALTKQIAKISAQVNDLEHGKSSLEQQHDREKQQREARVAQQRQQAPQPQQLTPQQQFERAISTLTPATQQWLRAHPEYVTDEEKRNEAVRVHKGSEFHGLKADTAEYFAFIERELGLGQAPQTRRPSPSTPSAPVSRDGGIGANPLKPSQVRLTPKQQDIAKDLGMTNQEYATGMIIAERKKQSKSQRMH